MNDYRSHVTMLGQPDKKGKSRYCCVTCGHQFTCSGRRRIIQHIIGRDYCLGYERDILACPNPNPPLKAALLLQYRKKGGKQKLLKHPAKLADNVVWASNPDFFSVSAVSSPSSSFYSAASVSTVSSKTEETMDIAEVYVDIPEVDLDVEEDLPDYVSANLVKREDIHGVPSYPESASCLYPSQFTSAVENRISPSFLECSPSIPPSTTQQSTMQLEQAISKFFSLYNIPDSAKHDPSFQQIFAVQTATNASDILFGMMNKKTSQESI
jgi:hypothetical protein